MSIIAKIKAFFGFGKKLEVSKVPTLLEQFESKYKALPESQKQEFLSTAIVTSEQEAQTYLTQNLGHVTDANEYFKKATEHFELELGLYKLKHKDALQLVDKEYEQLLGRLLKFAECFAKPGNEVFENVESYIQKFEEHILLSEADGEYPIKISENGKWVRFPFLDTKLTKHIRTTEAIKILDELFVKTTSLNLLELDTHVPWIPISTVEVLAKCKDGRMSLLSNPTNAKYYGYIYT